MTVDISFQDAKKFPISFTALGMCRECAATVAESVVQALEEHHELCKIIGISRAEERMSLTREVDQFLQRLGPEFSS